MANKQPKAIPALCAWCEKKIIIAGREYDTDKYLRRAGLTKGDIVSHGICKKCKTNLMQSIKNPRNTSPLWVKDKKKWMTAEKIVRRTYRGKRQPPAYFAIVTEVYKRIGGQIVSESRNNPSTRTWEAVIEMFRRFHDFDPGEVSAYNYDQAPRVVACLGELEAVVYKSDKWDGRRRSYIHKFKASDRPLLATDEAGERLYIIGGSYRIKEDGIIG
jgi:hypothetical protein